MRELKKYKSTYILIFLLSGFLGFAQTIPLGHWRTHLAYKEGIAIAQGNGKVYYASKGGMYSYNLSDNSFELMSKLSGLSDEFVSAINFDMPSNTLVIAYQNANIDIIQNNTVFNLPDIKIKEMQGNKIINSIYFRGQYAYLSCGFGIVVVDIIKHEISETYFIGTGGAAINIRDVNCDGTNLFASTDKGIYMAPLNSVNLADYSSWTFQTGLPIGIYNTMAYFNGKLYANFAKRLTNGTSWYQDTVYKYNGTSWSRSNISPDNFKRLRLGVNNTLIAVGEYWLSIYDSNENLTGSNYYNYGFGTSTPADAFIDNNSTAWIADKILGLVKVPLSGMGEALVPNGPRTTNVFALGSGSGNVWLVPGTITGNWGGNSWLTDGVSVFSNNSWSTIYGKQPPASMDTIPDVVGLCVDTTSVNHAFAGSWHRGLLEFKDGSLVKVYSPANSTLKSQQTAPGYYSVRVGGIAMDPDGNVWVSNSGVYSILSVKKKDDSWQSFDFFSFVSQFTVANEIVIASSLMVTKTDGQKWINIPRANSIVVYSDNGTFAQPNNTNTKILTAGKGKGNFPGNLVNCFTEDHDGAIWIGTDMGIAVIYSPENIFNGGNYDAQQIFVQQDGYTGYLLATEQITAIAVDGANRKWIGTQGSGVFLVSADGTTQINHFTVENSPLLSNEINAITIDGRSGEVFFGTINGVISYRGTATDGGDSFGQVYAFPNPVKHDYTGPIAIKGLVQDADVKITDITGALVYHTKALGGQAIWNGTNFSGQRAQTGVYLVFCSNDDGTKTYVTKILFIN